VVATLAGIGLVQGAIMAGGVLGAPAAPRLQGRLRPRTMSLTITVAGTLLFVAAALLMPSPLVALPVAVVVLLAPAANSGLFAATLRQTPDRVVSTMSVLAMGLAALAPLLAGLLVEHVSASWAVGAFAAAMAIAVVPTLVMPGMKDAGSPPAASA
jgi:MFS family permease